METKIFSVQNEEIGTVDLSDDVFDCEVSEGAIYYAIKNELANKRGGTASTKTRNEVRGAKSKPWRQKGTGRARAGRRRSPLWVGGGITFGPQPRDFGYKVPKKCKRTAIKSILSMKAKDESLKVVENFTIDSGKTKELAAILEALVQKERTILVLPEDDAMLKRAGRNIPNLSMLTYNRLNAHDLFYGRKLLMMQDAVSKLNDFYGNKNSKESKEKSTGKENKE
jgi:large subunit ribosomal protein L4